MRKRIITGKLSYPQIMIELGLRISFVQSMFEHQHFQAILYIHTIWSVCILLYAPGEDDNILFSIILFIWRYEEKRWVLRDAKPKSPSRLQEEKPSSHWGRPAERSGHNYASVSENTHEERKKVQPSNTIPSTRISVPAPPRGPEQVYLYLLYIIVTLDLKDFFFSLMILSFLCVGLHVGLQL